MKHVGTCGWSFWGWVFAAQIRRSKRLMREQARKQAMPQPQPQNWTPAYSGIDDNLIRTRG